MCELFWEFVRMKYPDEPEEFHESSKGKSLKDFNTHINAINVFLKDVIEDDDLLFFDYPTFVEHVTSNCPAELDPEVVYMYMNSIEEVMHLLCTRFDTNILLLDRFGSTAITTENNNV